MEERVNRPEVLLMSAFILFVSFQKKEVIIILLCIEKKVVLDFFNHNSGKDKKEKVAR